MTIFIYYLLDPLTGKIRYVGKTYDPQHRLGAHVRENGRSRKSNWVKSLISKGAKPVMEILEEVEDDDDTKWQDSERFWIAFFKSCGASLLNHDNGGMNGKMLSDETKQKMRIASTGRRHSEDTIKRMSELKKAAVTPEIREHAASIWRGKKIPKEIVERRSASARGGKRTEEFKEAQRLRSTGRKHTPATIEHLRAINTGKKMSEETRRRMSASKLGKKRGPYKMDPTKIHGNTGKTASEETRQKLSAAHVGLKQSEETKAKKRASRMAFLERQRAALMACEI